MTPADRNTSRRDFLRGLLGQGRDLARDGLLPQGLKVPGAAPAGADEPPPVPRAPTADEMRGAFTVPAGQEDIAERLVAMGRLLRAADGRVAEPAFAHRISLPPMGGATERWLDRARAGRPLEATRAQDAILLHAARQELGAR